jgi:16S rRNA (guanine527-N7)-methyltransferase
MPIVARPPPVSRETGSLEPSGILGSVRQEQILYLANEDLDRAAALAICPVSRETAARLDLLGRELRRWQAVKNLVGPGTLDHIWTRHIADSLQLLALAPEAAKWVDLGSGAGFPGLVLGIAALERSGLSIDLVESNGRKCAFLRHIARLTGAPVSVHTARVEAVIDRFAGADTVTARALAPLSQLLAWAEPLLTTGSMGLFPKGREVEAELTEAAKSWRFDAELIPSRTDSEGRIVRIQSLKARSSP